MYWKEVEVLTFYRAVVENGPDLFSLHRGNIEAPFRCNYIFQKIIQTKYSCVPRTCGVLCSAAATEKSLMFRTQNKIRVTAKKKTRSIDHDKIHQ